ncbi:MAG: Ig-like domain-containing protein [Candidatus Binatia bacterium]
MGARFLSGTKRRSGSLRAESGARGQARLRVWTMAFLVALCGGGAGRREVLAETIDLSRMAALSFSGSDEVVLLDGDSGKPVGAVPMGRVPRDLAVTSGEWLVAAEDSRIESVSLVAPGETHQLRMHEPDHVVAGVGPRRAYVSRSDPSAVVAVTVGAASTVDWATKMPGRVRALALDPGGRIVFAGYDWHPGRVAAIDAMTGGIERTLSIGHVPVALAVSRDGATLYALGRREGLLTAISIADGNQRATVHLGTNPRALAVSEDGARIYVTDPTKSKLTVVEGAGLTVQGIVELPGRPYDLAVTPDGTRVIVTSPRSLAVFVIDTATLRVVHTQRFQRRPRRVVVAPGTAKPVTPTVTATATLPSPTVPPTPAATATEVPSCTPTLLPSPTGTVTPIPTASATATCVLSSTPTLMPTSTPSTPPGVLVGQVMDDGTAQPLAGVEVVVAQAVVATTDARGRYFWLPSVAGEVLLELEKSGHSSARRRAGADQIAALRLQDARLTALATPVAVNDAGGIVRTRYAAPGVNGTVELSIPSGALSTETDVRLTVLSPQGLIAPVPLGWSVLLGIDLSLAATTPWPGGSAVRVPLALLGSTASLPVITAVWDDAAWGWQGGPPAVLKGDQLEVEVDGMAPSVQLVLLVADSLPVQPPQPARGEPLRGVEPVLPTPGAALVTVAPAAIVAGSGAGAQVLVEMVSLLQPLPSGTLLEVQLREEYERRDGRHITGAVSTQDIIGYQLTPTLSPSHVSTSLGAYFNLTPSDTFGMGELRQGRVAIDLTLPQGAGHPEVVGPTGGEIRGDGGLRLIVPPGATEQRTVVGLRPVAAVALPGDAGTRSDLLGAFALEVDGGVLSARAFYGLSLALPVPDGLECVIAQLATVDQRWALVLAGFGHSQNGLIYLDACSAAASLCLAGLGGSGTYAVFALPSGAAIITGTVTDGSGVRAGVVVEADTIGVVSMTDSAGRYLLPVPAGVTSTVSCSDQVRDLSGTAAVTPVPAQVVLADIALRPTLPKVVQIDPANHASQVPAGAVMTITFSEPIAPASITEASVQLLQIDSRLTSTTHGVSGRSSLSADGKQLLLTPAAPLAPNTVYRVVLTSDVTDLYGNPLSPRPLEEGQGEGAFVSDFTTAAIFKADALPPNTLHLSLPDDQGRVFVCGGASLAAPGTAVVVQNATGQVTYTASATDPSGVSGSDVCDALFPGRCDTSAPGSFCTVIDAAVGDKVQVQVQDVLHNTVTLDTGNMRDERTGATVIDTTGGVVTYPYDPRYQALIPDGAFTQPTIVQITPITANGVGLNVADYPVLTSLDQSLIELVGAVRLDFVGTAQRNLDVSVPAPADAAASDQYIATQVINFRGIDEQTMVDTASFDAASCTADPSKCLVVTDPGVFPGLTLGGTFGVHRTKDCLAYATGWISIGDQFNNGYVPGGALGALLPFPVQVSTPVRFAVPLPCNRAVDVKLQTFDDRPITAQTVNMPGQGQVVELPRRLTDTTEPPHVEGMSVPEGTQKVDPSAWLGVTFSKPLDPNSLNPATVQLVDGHGRSVKGTLRLSADGRVVTFVPDTRLHFGAQYRLSVQGILDRDGNQLPGAVTGGFTVFQPRVIGHITGVDARDVVVVDPVTVHLPPGKRLLAVAEGDGLRADFAGGINVYDVSDPSAELRTGLSSSPPVIASRATAGVDRALVFVPGPPVTTTGQHAATFAGPFIMSIDGPGGADRFGVWRLLDLEHFPTITEVASRLINQSAESWDLFNLRDPTQGPPPDFLKFIPNDRGIPEGVAAVDTQIAYIANAPNIGLQAVVVQQMDAGDLVGPQVDGTLTGLYRAVTILKNNILAVRQDGAANTLVLAYPNLTNVTGTYLLPGGGRLLAVTGLADWPTRIDGVDAQGQRTSTMERRDLAVVMCEGIGVCVVPVSVSGFDPLLLPNGAGVLRTPGRISRGSVGDPSTQLLYVADGTAGLTVIDLAVAGGSVDDDGDGIDDRVLGTVDLDGNRTARVARYVDMAGRQIVAVAAGTGGVYLVQVAPTVAGLTLYDTNNIEIVPDALKASDGTFVLVNDDNDDGAVDAAGAPILDLNKTGLVKGEHDLRRIDVSTPMSQGTVTIAIESGSDHAKLWLSPEKGDAVASPATFDLDTGQRPPTTIWVEALAPSQADRDIVVLYRWSPPTGVPMAPVEDRAALTAVDIRFIAGQHGQQAGSSTGGSGENEKLLFTEPEAEDLEQVLRGEETFDQLPKETFGRVDVIGVDPQSIVSASVHMARGMTPDAGTIVDATPPSGPTAFTMVSMSTREAASQQDALFYDGMPLGLTPEALRQATSGQDVLPIDPADTPISERQAGATMQLLKASGKISTLERNPAKLAELQVIDAREFAAEIASFKNGGSAADLRKAYAEKIVARDDMTGALADGSSRLVLRLKVPQKDPHAKMVFKAEVNQAKEPSPVGSHFISDVDYPFGSLSLTGLNSPAVDSPALSLVTDFIKAADGTHVFVAVFTPPTSFPWVAKPQEAGRQLPLRFTVQPVGEEGFSSNVSLVRPPVVFVHGLFGDSGPETWTPYFLAYFQPFQFERVIVDYADLNTSGYDRISRAVRRRLPSAPVEAQGVLDVLDRLRKDGIAATKVDVVAHSMGGVAIRWLASESLRPSSSRFVTDAAGTTNGQNFPFLDTRRSSGEQYQRPDNFGEGDVRALVAIGSPFGGSPAANWLLRRGMQLDRLNFGIPPQPSPLDLVYPPARTEYLAAVAVQLIMKSLSGGKAATAANDVGTAIMDLSIGSGATQALDTAVPGPLLVHAIATEATGALTEVVLQLFNAISGVAGYCPGFGPATSDGVVPEGSALYGTDDAARSVIGGYDHLRQTTKAKEVASEISQQLLFDRWESPSGGPWVNSFDSGFSSGGGTFTCQ